MMSHYYDQHAQAFIEGTLHVDMQPLYQVFTPYLPQGGKVLDAGCGAGRDSKYFAEQGFIVHGFDASSPLVEFAQRYVQASQAQAQATIVRASFLSYQSELKFDGIWACASLLHVPETELTQTFAHLQTLLAKEGVFYCSFKYGQGQVERDGRSFTNLDECRLQAFLEGTNLQIAKTWVTGDRRVGREDEQWLNALLQHRLD